MINSYTKRKVPNVRNTKTLLILISFLFSGCECVEDLNKVCPVPQECWVEQDVENIEENLILNSFSEGSTRGKCQTGTTACDSKGKLFCEGIVYPVDEVCDFEDNNCDGETDEGFDRDLDGYTVCAGDCDDLDREVHPYNLEICDGKDNDCINGIPLDELTDNDADGYVQCEDCDDNNRNVFPNSPEICDAIDNNCNGIVDEDVIESLRLCGPPTATGQCRQDFPICVQGELYCVNAIYESNEACDNVDNDCDGSVDEFLFQECNTACGNGIERCSHGEWEGCSARQPTEEICDGLDNDCNGHIDDALGGCECEPRDVSVCTQGVVNSAGEPINCGIGVKECDDNGDWGDCEWVLNQPEECNNYDDDCDGIIDEIIQICGDAELDNVGVCFSGRETCSSGTWSECEGLIGPSEEVCDSLDNDCDGEVDEDLEPHNKVDMLFLIDGSGSMCVYVEALLLGIGEYVSDFDGSEHKFGLIVFPYIYRPLPTPGFPSLPWIVTTNLTDVNSFIALLTAMNCNFPGVEPSYDVMFDATDSSNPMGINWRSDAKPYVILMTDESDTMTWIDMSENNVALNTSNCQVGNCSGGEFFEVFVFTHSYMFSLWDSITFFEPDRLLDIYPPDPDGYVEKLRGIFTNVCR